MATDLRRRRGRPRRFDPEEGLATAQRLFHARGYDALGVAELTDALGISPPSFYAAYGSKAALYARVLCRYAGTEGIPLSDLLQPGRPPVEALAAVLEEAARRYGADPAAAGCMTIEGARCNDSEARTAARVLTSAGKETIRVFVAKSCPDVADRLADYVVTVMTGLSAMAREGHSLDRLLTTARLASLGLGQALAPERARLTSTDEE
jgi:TetR/AcrR family transcriptional repressor for divergent bdcA